MSKELLKAAAKKLEKQIGVNVGSAFGFPNAIEGEPEHFIIVWSDDEVDHPKVFEGFTVVRRGIPRAY
jgi:fructose-specific phosphotransferase system component IIB